MALVGLGAGLAVVVALVALRFGRADLFARALGGEDLARLCTPPLVDALRQRGFEPADLAFESTPEIGSPFASPRSFGSRFTFRDGGAGVRVDGIVACAVSGGHATVEVRVSAPPRRAA